MNHLCRSLACTIVVLKLANAPQTIAATTVPELQEAGKLQVRSWLTPDRAIVPWQQLTLKLEIATDRWFAGGTRIRIPEIPGLVILQTDDFASNSSEQRNGESWVVQRWSLEIYPRRAGRFEIGPVAARVKVSAADGGVISGEVLGPALSFSVSLPESLARAEHWVAAPQYSVSQSFDRDLQNLAVGDAIERQIVFSASDVMAMMLPAFSEAPIPGLTAYPEPPEVENRSNRGEMLATRRQRITYIVAAEGEYQLPATDYFWWDTRTGELQLLALPAVRILAGTAAPDEVGRPSSTDFEFVRWRALGGTLLALLAVFWVGRKLRGYTPWQRIRCAFRSVAELWRELRRPGLPAELNPGSRPPSSIDGR